MVSFNKQATQGYCFVGQSGHWAFAGHQSVNLQTFLSHVNWYIQILQFESAHLGYALVRPTGNSAKF